MPTKYMLASDAIKIEQDFIGEAVGSQDQTAAAGGLNRIDFGGQREINVITIILDPKVLKTFEDHLALFFYWIFKISRKYCKRTNQVNKPKIKRTKKYE